LITYSRGPGGPTGTLILRRLSVSGKSPYRPQPTCDRQPRCRADRAPHAQRRHPRAPRK
jgi:hypothetical protein